MATPKNYRPAPLQSDERCETCLYYSPFLRSKEGYCELYRAKAADRGVCDAYEHSIAVRASNPAQQRYWIQEAIRKPGDLRNWLRSQANRQPWGFPKWQPPPRKGPIDPKLVLDLIDCFEELQRIRGRLTKVQLRRYRQLLLLKTLKKLGRKHRK